MGIAAGAGPEKPLSIEQSLAAYEHVVARFGYDPVVRPGRIDLLGWDLEYVCGPALANFIDQILVRRLNDFIPDTDRPLILDCGANIGFSVLNYRRQFPNARIVAFEPDPQFAPVLRRNLARNGAADVEVVEAAAWVCNGKAPWLCEGIDGSKIVEPGRNSPNITEVQTIDLADYVTDSVDLLKLDIEGAEYTVIGHLGDRLGLVKNISVECHLDQSNITAFGKMLETLASVSFNVGVNTFGPWRDLVRRPPVPLHHWEQYLLVSGCRHPAPAPQPESALSPYAGAPSGLELRALRAEAKRLNESLQSVQSELQSRQARIPELLEREDRLLQLLRALVGGAKETIQRREFTGGFGFDGGRCWIAMMPDLEPRADDEQNPVRSSLLLFEGEALLGPPHSQHDDIRRLGGGVYSHWKSNLYFSTSDGSDPNTNRRPYTAVFSAPAGEGTPDLASSLRLQQEALSAREAELSRRGADLTLRQEGLDRREELASRLESDLRAQESEMAEREALLSRRDIELGERDARLAQREAALQELLRKYNSMFLVRARSLLRRIFGA